MAEKVGMTQVFDEDGNALPVTVLKVLENVVTQKKEESDKDGYNALQIGAEEVTNENRLTKAEVGHCKKNDVKPFRHLKEFRVPAEILEQYNIGDEVKVEEIIGEKGTLIDITGKPKGKGTMGRIKRYNQSRRLMTHGTKHSRQMGSAGPGTTPGRVFPGKKMPGRNSNKTTIAHLEVFSYNPEHRLLLVVGSIPGHNNSLVSVKQSKPKEGWNKYAVNVGRRQEKKAVA